MILKKSEGGSSLFIAGDVDIENAALLKEALLECLSSPVAVSVDLSGVERLDTAGLQVLLAAERQATQSGKSLSLVAPSAAVTQTAQALGFSFNSPQ